MRTMYDSVTARDIPASARMVAGYVNGTYKWSDADWARFPNATKVRIATRGNVNDGHVLDVEAGAASASDIPGWLAMRRRAGVTGTVYCSLSMMGTVRDVIVRAGIPEPPYWIARYDNVATPIQYLPGKYAVAKQYINPPQSGGHYDLSIVADYWPGVDDEVEMPLTQEDIERVVSAVWGKQLPHLNPQPGDPLTLPAAVWLVGGNMGAWTAAREASDDGDPQALAAILLPALLAEIQALPGHDLTDGEVKRVSDGVAKRLFEGPAN